MTIYTKDPSAVLDYAFDWATIATGSTRPWLADGETIATATVAVPAGLTKARTDTVASGVVTTWLTGGVVGQTYTVTCHVVTNQGREDDRTIRIRVRDR